MPTMLQRAFMRGSEILGGRAVMAGGSRRMAAYGVASNAMGAVAGANPAAARGVVGSMLGGIYGAASDDTSIAGGAAMGAGLFAGGPLAVGRARGMYGAYGALRSIGRGRGQALHAVLNSEAMASKAFFKRSYNRAVNGIRSTLKAGQGGLGTLGY